MAGFTSALKAPMVGLKRIFEYVNADGRLTKWNCGQAAATTLLTHHGHLPLCEETACATMRGLESAFPPDIVAGWFGSSRRRVTRICKAHGLCLKVVRGEEPLRVELEAGNPVVVMLGVSAGRIWKWDVPGGHWMVAYGFDDDAVYLTNWGEPMPWSEFRERWRSAVSRFIQMNERGLAAISTQRREIVNAQ